MTERIRKLNDLLRDQVGKILLRELDFDDDILVTVTHATVSPTLEHATIWISVLPEGKTKETLARIKKEIFHLQQILNKVLVMRPVPKIRFEIDRTEEHAEKIEKLLQKITKK